MSAPLLFLSQICKRYENPAFYLDHIDMEINTGRSIALMGDNATGKSVLLRIITGRSQPDEGALIYKGKLAHFASESHARELGVMYIDSSPRLFEQLTVAENLLAAAQHNSRGSFFVNMEAVCWRCREIFDSLGINVEPTAPVYLLDAAQKLYISLASAVFSGMSLLVLDDTTIELSLAETQAFNSVVGRILELTGMSVIFTVRLADEIPAHCTDVTLIKDGRLLMSSNFAELSKKSGGRLRSPYPKLSRRPSVSAIAFEGLCCGGVFNNVSFDIRRGEIVGFYGLSRSEQLALIRLLTGQLRPTGGRILLDNVLTGITSSAHALRLGIGILPPSRIESGLFDNLSLYQNISSSSLESISVNKTLLSKKVERSIVDMYLCNYHIKVDNPGVPIAVQSVGTQQLALLLRLIFSYSRIFVLFSPTAGLDATRKLMVYNMFNKLIYYGACIILISSDSEELREMCDRLVLFSEGRSEKTLSCTSPAWDVFFDRL